MGSTRVPGAAQYERSEIVRCRPGTRHQECLPPGYDGGAYAATSDLMKPPTSAFSRSDCDDNPFAASSRREAAAPASSEARVTFWMLLLTSRVPLAACCTLPAISRVAGPADRRRR